MGGPLVSMSSDQSDLVRQRVALTVLRPGLAVNADPDRVCVSAKRADHIRRFRRLTISREEVAWTSCLVVRAIEAGFASCYT